jgi:hypothetical protein
MNRAFVFVILGPIFGVFAGWLHDVARRGFHVHFDEGVIMAILFSLVVSVITKSIDGYFAHVLPIFLRAPLTAIAGAAVAVATILLVLGKGVPPQSLMHIALSGALCMGACSLLSFGDERR